MFVLKDDMSKEIKFTGRWYINKGKCEVKVSHGFVSSLEIYPDDTMFVEVRWNESLPVIREGGYYIGRLWWKRWVPEENILKDIPKRKFVSEYELIEIMECGK